MHFQTNKEQDPKFSSNFKFNKNSIHDSSILNQNNSKNNNYTNINNINNSNNMNILNSAKRSPNKFRTRFKKNLSTDDEKKKKKEETMNKMIKKHENIELLRIKKMKEIFEEEQYFNRLELGEKSKIEISEYAHFIRSQKENLFHVKYDLNAIIQGLLAVMSIFTAISHYEIARTTDDNWKALVSQYYCFACSLLLWWSIVYGNYLKTEIEGINQNIKGSIIRNTFKNWFFVIFEIMVFFLHPNPVFIEKTYKQYNVRYEVEIETRINSIFTLVCFLRFYYLVKMYLIKSDYFCPRTARIGRLWGLDLETYFALKANLIAKPYQTFMLLFFSILFVGMYATRIFEIDLDDYSGFKYRDIWNAIWAMFITMTTVGYGDKYPNSIGGRIIGIFNCFLGAFLISLSVSTFTNLLNFENNEESLCLLIDRLSLHKEKEEKSKQIVIKYFKTMKKIKKIKKDSEKINDEVINNKKVELFKEFLDFRNTVQRINATYPSTTQEELYLSDLSTIEKTLIEFSEKVMTLNDKINQYADKYEELVAIEEQALSTYNGRSGDLNNTKLKFKI